MTPGPYEARHAPGIPTDCCDFGVISLSQGREVCRVWERDDAEQLATILNARPPVAPKSLHWLGDREDADATRHATDMRGCVMYFERQSDCLQFMRWLGRLPANGSDNGAADRVTKCVNDLFWSGAIDGDDADKILAAVHG